MSKKFGMSLLQRNEKKPKKTIESVFEDMESILLSQIYECKDGRRVAIAHAKDGYLLVAGVFVVLSNLADDENYASLDPNSPVWDYLELGLEFLGFKEEGKMVRHDFEKFSLQMFCRDEDLSKSLEAFIARDRPPRPQGKDSLDLLRVR
jgi:hypothetical protein